MKKVYLVHGWGGNSKGGWFDWLRTELTKRKIKVYAFDMPDTDNPKIENWVGYLKQNIKKVDKETYFVGHSIGVQTIMRFLENLPKHKAIGGCVFVAGWFNLINLDEDETITAEPWLKNHIDWKKVKEHTDKFLCMFSDNDPYVPLSDIELFKERFKAEIITKNKFGHFNEVDKIPEVLDFIIK
jgi:uncharacterized protein